MLTLNPFAELALIVQFFMKFFVILMVLLIAIALLDMLHKKMLSIFRNAQKAKKSAKTQLSTGVKTAVILKTVASDIATTSELGFGQRGAHVLGMYGTIYFGLAHLFLFLVIQMG